MEKVQYRYTVLADKSGFKQGDLISEETAEKYDLDVAICAPGKAEGLLPADWLDELLEQLEENS